MCEFSGKLIAWLDRELPAEEAAVVERHLEACAECRGRVDAYRLVSEQLDAYCEEKLEDCANRRRTNPWTAVAAAAGAAVTLVALFFIWPRAQVQPPAFHSVQAQEPAATSPISAESAPPVPIRPARKISRQAAIHPARLQDTVSTHAQNGNAYAVPEGPVIQISIPADEMFPPGAVPQGMHFVADVTIAADGSTQSVSLRPRLAGFERRTDHP